MTDRRYSIREIAEALDVVPSSAKRRAAREEWPFEERTGRGGTRRLYAVADLPDDLQKALILQEAREVAPIVADAAGPRERTEFKYDAQALWANYNRKPTRQKQTAEAKLHAFIAIEALLAQGFSQQEAFQSGAAGTSWSWKTLRDIYHGKPGKPGLKQYARADWLAALVPGYVGRTVTAEITPEAWDFFKADYLRLEQPSIADCYQRLQRTAAENGWTIPAQRTMTTWTKSRIPATVRILKREGELALMKRFPSIERSVKSLHALQWINGDGYQHNVFVRWPDGSIDRPKVWYWQDVRSRKMLSYRIDRTENTDTIRLSFGDLVEQYGIPEHATIDNTRAAANKWMTGGTPNRYRFKVKEDDPLGIFNLLDIKVHWTTVDKAGTRAHGRGQAKPVERAFGIGGLGECVDKHPDFAGAYTGPNVTAKPENYAEKAVPLETFIRVLNEEIIHWNARRGRRTEMAGGILSFDEVFNESYAIAPIQKATEAQRQLWLLAAESITVGKDGTFTLAAGAQTGKGRDGRNRYFAPELQEVGERRQKIVVRFDPDDLHHQVFAYTLDGRFIATADCLEAYGFGDTTAGRAWNKARRQFVQAGKAQANAEIRMSLAEVSEQLPRPDLPDAVDAKVVRAMRAPIEPPTAPEQPLKKDPYWHNVAELSRADIEASLTELQHDAPEENSSSYQRWLNVRTVVEEGEALSDIDAAWWAKNENNVDFVNKLWMQEMREKFDRATSGN